MDGQRFDQLSRGLAARLSRRRVLAGLLGAAAGSGALAVTGADAASQTCRRPGDKCVRTSQCCGGSCQLSAGRRSRLRTCVCPAGTIPCNRGCVTLGTEEHCLACNDACSAGSLCCDDGCTEMGTQDNCAACGDVCDGASDEVCFGEDGCQHGCFGHTTIKEDGYLTTDNPPRYFEGRAYSPFAYTQYVTNDPNNLTVTPCTTSADCPACATHDVNSEAWVQTGCGCLQIACGSDVGGDNGQWKDLYSLRNTYFCAATKKDR